ncbi:unnamed protein product [Larinioides sclopetarius]|uniref:Uncharacterized protein n=1 Tax=Larinioides sclopetarius TaxID=280406 RepID=A0AAV1ZFL0_9ARAC
MQSYLSLLFVLGASFGNGYVLVESGSVPRRLSEEQNPENIKIPLQDVKTSADDSTDEDAKVMKDLEDRFTTSLVRLLEHGDELYKDSRFDSIINTLKTTMLTVTGEIDEDYIRKVVETFRRKDAANRKEVDEIMMNQLGFSQSDLQDFLDIFAKDIKRSGSPSAPRSPRSLASAISK